MRNILIALAVGFIVFVCLTVVAARIKAWVHRTWRPQSPGHPPTAQFLASRTTEPKFVIISITGPGSDPLTTQPSAVDGQLADAVGFIPVMITENPAGICKLTGSQVKYCACERHGRGARP